MNEVHSGGRWTAADEGTRNLSSLSEGVPIAVFAYNRPRHLDRLIECLLNSELFSRSPVFVFCDGARDQHAQEAVAQTRSVARRRLGSIAKVIDSARNMGLAQSIIAGVTELCDRYGSVIVLEDDLELHPRCLEFLNAAIRHYANDAGVYHVNAYRYPLPPASTPHLSRLTSSWGWATWQRAWINFEADAAKLESRIKDASLISAMDFDGAFPYYDMLRNQVRGKIDSWAIRWYASTLLRSGLAVCPNVSQVRNHGFDGTGVHSGVSSIYNVDLGTASEDWPACIAEDMVNYRQMQTFFCSIRGSWSRRILRKLKRMLVAG
jgi:glycosyltransferase involved in cell wall biosynthesis